MELLHRGMRCLQIEKKLKDCLKNRSETYLSSFCMSTNLFATLKLQAQEEKNELEPVKASIPRPTNGAHVYTWAELGVCPCIPWHTQNLEGNTSKDI